MFSGSGQWQYCKVHTAKQDSHKVWETLHNLFYGPDCIPQYVSAIMKKLTELTYDQDTCNRTFDKYCQV